ncbi:carboxymuconolactone decarboxylase family protein [Streptomyces sp. NBC_01465]|uniref:carboxymuconolactone decarboxylase family protein n=1 Tax=Streptomyces sp. NBC_01465 TaxID=2903878 RepID=UPI002E355505|nr:carboxymuconolactone decarboxylase family protein [Streptomyces sp. NBC_01465]
MQARMKNPAQIVPGAMTAILDLVKAIEKSAASGVTMELVHMRVSQINGCSACVVGGIPSAKKSGVTDDQLHSVAVWREAPYFSDSERAALELAESATRLADGRGVPDDVWDAAADHFTEDELAAIILMIGLTNLFNRLNATTRQVAGATW